MHAQREFSLALDKHLPCKSFYNYLDREMMCTIVDDDDDEKESNAPSDKWLEAYFSDEPRMRALKLKDDPQGLFQSPHKRQKWAE